MTTLINIAQKIGIENKSTIRVILTNYETEKLFNALPRCIIDKKNGIEYHFNLNVVPSSSIYEIKYMKHGQESLIKVNGFDLRQLLINTILEIIEFRIKNKNYKCNNEFEI